MMNEVGQADHRVRRADQRLAVLGSSLRSTARELAGDHAQRAAFPWSLCSRLMAMHMSKEKPGAMPWRYFSVDPLTEVSTLASKELVAMAAVTKGGRGGSSAMAGSAAW